MKKEIAAWLFCILATFSFGQSRKVAILVGACNYQSPYNKLAGPPEDRKDVATSLKKFDPSFEVKEILSGKRNDILAAIRAVAEQGDLDTFVFFYAGHGTSSEDKQEFALIAEDGQNIYASNLREEILKVKARARIVLLDACFSGGMSQYSEGTTERSQFPQDKKTKGPVTAEVYDRYFEKLDGKDDQICYVTAAGPNQVAVEAAVDGKQKRGLFSYDFSRLISSADSKSMNWGSALRQVADQMRQQLKKQPIKQDPQVYPHSYLERPLFSGSSVAAIEATPPKGLLDLYSIEKPVGGFSTLEGSQQLAVGQSCVLHVKAPAGCSAVIIGAKGDRLYRLWPVRPNERHTFGYVPIIFDAPGVESLKVFYFSGQGSAQAFAKSFPSARSGTTPVRTASNRSSSSHEPGDISQLAKNLKGTATLSFNISRTLELTGDALTEGDVPKIFGLFKQQSLFAHHLAGSVAECASIGRLRRIIERNNGDNSKLLDPLLIVLNRSIERNNYQSWDAATAGEPDSLSLREDEKSRFSGADGLVPIDQRNKIRERNARKILSLLRNPS